MVMLFSRWGSLEFIHAFSSPSGGLRLAVCSDLFFGQQAVRPTFHAVDQTYPTTVLPLLSTRWISDRSSQGCSLTTTVGVELFILTTRGGILTD
jgi:DNA-binding transcriptional LysR family regulator